MESESSCRLEGTSLPFASGPNCPSCLDLEGASTSKPARRWGTGSHCPQGQGWGWHWLTTNLWVQHPGQGNTRRAGAACKVHAKCPRGIARCSQLWLRSGNPFAMTATGTGIWRGETHKVAHAEVVRQQKCKKSKAISLAKNSNRRDLWNPHRFLSQIASSRNSQLDTLVLE